MTPKRSEREDYLLKIDAAGPRRAISPSLYGVFFEDINHAGEGGLYAEMVLNRDFEINTLPKGASWAGNLLRTAGGWHERKWFSHELHGWSLAARGEARGSIRQESENPLNDRNPHSMRLHASAVGERIGVANGGFWGMNVQRGNWYDLSFYARTENGQTFNLAVVLEDAVGRQEYARATVADVAGPWKQYRCSLRASDSDRAARLVIEVDRVGTIWFDVVSLFPRETFRHRPNGLRADIAQLLADMKPAFVRFPGGAVVGGLNLDNRFQWKNSIGDISRRQGTMNLWGYYSTHGLGYHEILQFCEDIGADAMFVCNPGMSDGYRIAEVASARDLPAFIQEAMDALDYALGPADSTWGRRRAANGHPAAFPLKYIEIGNEAGGPTYVENYRQFHAAIRDKYPALGIISNQRIEGDATVEIVDDHIYANPRQLVQAAGEFDAADRNGPAIYVGEYACNSDVGQGNLAAALAEAVFLMGLERNSDLVTMSSYAPLLFNVNDIAWPVNMIGFDSGRVAPRSSYYVQRLFSRHRPDELLATSMIQPPGDREVFAIAGIRRESGGIIIKAVNLGHITRAITVDIAGLGSLASCSEITTLRHDDPTAENTLDDPDVVMPVTSTLPIAGKKFTLELGANSLTILRMEEKQPSAGARSTFRTRLL